MNIDKLLQAETHFLQKYPAGFNDPEMVAIGKKHKMTKMIEFTQESFKKTAFANTEEVLQNWIKTVSRSSMVSVFEKPKFKEFINSLSPKDKTLIAEGLYQQLHGKDEKGFNAIVDILIKHKMGKWSIISVVPAYFNPTVEVFVKPTTAKGVVKTFELEGLTYKPAPSWAFYVGYRKAINDMKNKVDEHLSPSNAAFSGFLMMSL